MKLLIASDIHGCIEQLDFIIQKFFELDADKLILLGDLCHAGFNYFGLTSNTQEILNKLSMLTEKLILLKGNCDTATDELYSPVGLLNEYELKMNGRNLYFHHGHKPFKNNSFKEGDICFSGHSHRSQIILMNGVYFCNPGSLAFPRGYSVKSYMVIDESTIKLYSLTGLIKEEFLR